VIARLTVTHQKINQESFQEWQFVRADNVKQFLLLEERNPCCMLPPPLNIFPFLMFPFHVFHLRGVAAQASDSLGELYLLHFNQYIAGSRLDAAYRLFTYLSSIAGNDNITV
jgi:hypothetical protein